MIHNLSLEVPFISNPKVLKVSDLTVWNNSVPSESIKLNIICPGFIYGKSFDVKRGFDKLFNSSSLGIYVVTDLNDLTPIPDGIYIIRLTNVSGVEEYVEYNHLRQTQILEKWYKALCKLRLSACDKFDEEKEEERRLLYQIKSYIDAAKAQVEYCNAPNEGLELHNYANSLLDKYNNSCKNC